MQIEEEIRQFLIREGWCLEVEAVRFLAAGEYNSNYLIIATGGRSNTVFRINHGSQLGLENQIEYEFNALKSVAPAGVTPKPLYYHTSFGSQRHGVLLMEYVVGSPLNYHHDWSAAAQIFAGIHALPPSPDLIIQDDPIRDIAHECEGLLHRYPDHPLTQAQSTLLKYHQQICRLGDKEAGCFKNEPLCMVNTEVNSHNFVIGPEKAFLVDWEKAVVSYRYQDLGHFLVPTTTLWKSDVVYTDTEKRSFLSGYKACGSVDLPLEELWFKTRLLEKTILLRALSWCYLAYYEYTHTQRHLKNRETLGRIVMYLNDIEWFIADLAR